MMVQVKGGFQVPELNWQNLIRWLSGNWKIKNLTMISWKICLAATVYIIWLERNHRLYNRLTNSVNQILDRILEMVKMKLSTLKGICDTIENRNMAVRWHLPSTVFGN